MELIDIIDRQNKLIAELVSENLEQEAIIKNLMDVKLSPYRDWETDRKSTRLNSSHITRSRMPSSA